MNICNLVHTTVRVESTTTSFPKQDLKRSGNAAKYHIQDGNIGLSDFKVIELEVIKR